MNAIDRHHQHSSFAVTRHAVTRLRQRGFRESDLDVILDLGRETKDGKLLLADSDINDAIMAMKRDIARLDRLRRATAVMVNGRVVTIYKHGRRSRRHRSQREG